MNNLIESIADFEKLAKSGLVCLVDQKEESVHYLVGTTNEELIHYFCKNHVSRTIHTPGRT